MIKTGDIVRFLNAVGGGKVTKVQGNMVYVEDADGFETPVLAREVVVTTPAGDSRAMQSADLAVGAQVTESHVDTPPTSAAPAQFVAEDPFEETPEGEKLNVVLGYEPSNIKRLTESVFDAFLVNDSNYYLLFTYLTQQSSSAQWITRYAGRVEPGTQVLLGQLSPDELGDISRVAVQYVAYKDDDKTFDLKLPARVEYRFDATKFFKLHCFRENVYFDGPVISFDIVKDDVPCREMNIASKDIEKAIKEKTRADSHSRKPIQKHNRQNDVHVVDLHVAELIDSTAGMSNADILNLQIDKFREVMDANLKNIGKKIVFIHGKGEGVLRQAIMKELNHRYKGHDVQDASFREYGFGATQVTIKNIRRN